MLRNKDGKLNEKGFASIVMSLVLIVVLALITIGFAQLARREQRNAVDKQLANQAYYAAESGVNDVAQALPAIAAAATPPDKNKCLDSSQLATFGLNPAVNTARAISYSCVLVNTKPNNLLYGNVAAGTDRHVTFSTDPSTLNSLTISWGSNDSHTSYLGATTGFKPLPGATGWGNAPAVLQVSITPVPSGSMTRSDLTDAMFTAYLYPSTSSGGVSYDTSAQGKIVPGHCSGTATYPCSVTISGLNVDNTQAYILSIVDYYDASNVTIKGTSGGNPVAFIGAQAQVDVTGKSQEVLRRIRVNIPIHTSFDLAPTIEAQDICKRFTTDPTAAAGFDTALSPVCQLDN